MPKKSKVRGRYSTISLPVTLIEKIKKKIRNTGFTSLSSYIEFLARISIEKDEENKGKNKVISKDKEKVKARLRALGYID